MTVNERLQRRLLRRAALNTRLENGCLRAVRRSLAMLTRLAVWHVRRHTDLFVKGERAIAGVPDPDRVGRLEREVLAPLRATVREQLREIHGTITEDLLALARLELFDLPQAVQAEVEAALLAPVTTTAEVITWPRLEEPWGALLQEETARPLEAPPPLGVVFTAVPEAQVAQLLASATAGSTVPTVLERMAETLLAQARTVLIGGLLQGQGVPSVARALQSVLGGARWQSERVVRSEFVRVANQAAILTFDRNAKYLKGVRWVATLDQRTCLVCARLDGRVFLDIKKAKVPVIDSHPNCFVPETRVEGAFLAGARMLYEGRVVRIETAQGRTLTTTPHHPILSVAGLVAAHRLREGDYLVCRPRDIVEHTNQQQQNVPSQIEQVFHAIRSRGFDRVQPRSREDLHGDAAFGHGDIDVVRLDRELTNDGTEAPSRQSLGERRLVAAGSAPAQHDRDRGLAQLVGRAPAAAHGGPGSAALALHLGAVGLQDAPLEALCFGTTADLDTAVLEALCEHAPADPSFVRQMLQRRAGLVARGDGVEVGDPDEARRADAARVEAPQQNLVRHTGSSDDVRKATAPVVVVDQIVKIRYGHFRGHVYDLQSITGLLVAGGIVASNCRCTIVPVIKAASDLGLPAGTRASFDGQVPATLKYPEWFRQQDAAFQRAVLGPTRYKLWAAGKAQLKDFATAAGVRDVKDVVARVAGRTA